MNRKTGFPASFNLFAAIAAFLFASILNSTAAAQTQKAPTRSLLEVTIVSVRPEMAMDFETLIKTEYNPAFVKGGGKQSAVWQTAAFGPAFDIIFVEPIERMSQYDGPSSLEKGLGKDGAGAFFAKASKMVTNVRSYAVETRPDLSFMANPNSMPRMAVVSHIRVAQNRDAEFENYIRNEWLPVIKQAGIPGYLMHRMIFGGDANEYVSLALADNFADIEKGPPVARVLGSDGMLKLMQKMPSGAVLGIERNIVRLNNDLSVFPAQPTAKK